MEVTKIIGLLATAATVSIIKKVQTMIKVEIQNQIFSQMNTKNRNII